MNRDRVKSEIFTMDIPTSCIYSVWSAAIDTDPKPKVVKRAYFLVQNVFVFAPRKVISLMTLPFMYFVMSL